MLDRINLSTPHMSDEGYELEFIHDAFNKNWIAPLGENVNEFEKAVKSYTKADNAVALSAGTAALHLSLICAGAGKGDLVFCQDLTFSASANPITYVGAEPVFIDSEAESWNMDPDALEKAIKEYGIPKAVIVVHLYGNPAKMNEICRICNTYSIPLIEDAAEALGSSYDDEKCGTFGKYGILSFNGNKIITTSGGGMLLCKDAQDAKKALKLATQAREPYPWYQHNEIGYNYRMSNICAGIGRGQMKVLDDRINKKRAIFDRYYENLKDLPITFQNTVYGGYSNHWLTSFIINKDCAVSPMTILEHLSDNNIECRPLWKPMHAQPVFTDAKFVSTAEEAVSDDLFARGLCLPSDTKMSLDDVDRVSTLIREVLK